MGSVKVGSIPGLRTRCIVVGYEYPSWLPHCGALGLQVVAVYLQESKFKTRVIHQVSEDCVVHVDKTLHSFPKASVVLVDGPASNSLLIEASRIQVGDINSTPTAAGARLGGTPYHFES